jgi:hypothetical protein
VRLAMDLSEKIAAVAPVTAQVSKALKDKTPKLPISIMIVNGTKDPLVPFDGGHIRLFRFGRSRGEILSTVSTVEHFRRYNGCDKTPKKSKLKDKAPDDGTTADVAMGFSGNPDLRSSTNHLAFNNSATRERRYEHRQRQYRTHTRACRTSPTIPGRARLEIQPWRIVERHAHIRRSKRKLSVRCGTSGCR